MVDTRGLSRHKAQSSRHKGSNLDATFPGLGPWALLLREQFPANLLFGELDPGPGAAPAVDLHFCVDEFAVLEHVQPRLRAGVSAFGTEDDRPGLLARS